MSSSYKRDSTFNPVRLGKVQTMEDVVKALVKLEEGYADIAGKANKEFGRVESAKGAGGSTVIITGGSSSSGGGSSGGATSLLDLGFRSGKQAVLAAGTDVSYSLPLASGDFILFISCYITTNPKQSVDFNYSLTGVSGFNIVPLENATCEYFLIPKT